MNKVWVGMICSDVVNYLSVFANKELALKWFNEQLRRYGVNTDESLNNEFEQLYFGDDYLYYSNEDSGIEIECDERVIHETEDWIE